MKVEGPSSTTQAAHRRAASVAAPGFSLPDMNVAQQANVRHAANASSIANVGSLLALQAIPDTKEERKKRATRRANDLLDQLDDLKISTLTGGVNVQQLINLKSTLQSGIEDVEDEELRQILLAIEQRAEVELAKLERFL